MSLDFTVAIPTYNGETRLPDVLEKLRSQVNTEQIKWEILVIDNNSNDGTKSLIQKYQNNWNKPYHLKYIFEPKQGAAFARKRAIKETAAPLIAFLDDDNLPEINWVSEAYLFAQQYPQSGAYGSQVHGEYESELPPNFQRIKAFLAITERGDQPLIYNRKSRYLPPSAGLVVRKQAWLENVPDHCILSGRSPGSMLTSEDLEVLAYIQQSAWEIWYNPKMVISHKIPASRLTRKYLIALMRGIGLSRYVTRTIGIKPWLKPFITIAYAINDCRKIITHLIKYNLILKPDLVADCELSLYIASLFSFLYLWLTGAFNSK